MLIKFKSIIALIAIMLTASTAWGANNIIHLWTDSTLSNTVAVGSSNNYVYIADRALGMVTMAVYDSIPPQFASLYDPGVPLFDIDVHGTYAYLAAGTSEPYLGWILIVDIESSANPIFVGSFESNWEFTKVAVGNYAYGYQYMNTLKIINISDPAHPSEAGSISISSVADLYARGNYVYLACQNLGLKIVDASNPGNPQVVGTCDTPGLASGITMRTIDSTHVYIADGSAGIQIIDISTPSSPAIVGNFQTDAAAVSITGGRLLVYATLADSTVAAVMVGNPLYTKLVGATDIPHLPNGISIGYEYESGIAVGDGYMLDIYKIHTTPCPRVPGDINNSGATNGIDVTYGIAYFKGGNIPPQICQCWSHPNFCINCDVNASCQFNGVDITYLVSILGGRDVELLPCPDCPEDY
jgi:hypothetical protein